MLRIMFAIVVAVLIFAAVSETAHAAPIAPLPVGIPANLNTVTDVAWRHCWRDSLGYLHCRRCWRGRWGLVRCW
jgi:hypothetical protein